MENSDSEPKPSLGMNLINNLVKQIDASIEFRSTNGFSCSIRKAL
jgi:two-component sensor histidine kinase